MTHTRGNAARRCSSPGGSGRARLRCCRAPRRVARGRSRPPQPRRSFMPTSSSTGWMRRRPTTGAPRLGRQHRFDPSLNEATPTPPRFLRTQLALTGFSETKPWVEGGTESWVCLPMLLGRRTRTKTCAGRKTTRRITSCEPKSLVAGSAVNPCRRHHRATTRLQPKRRPLRSVPPPSACAATTATVATRPRPLRSAHTRFAAPLRRQRRRRPTVACWGVLARVGDE
jgi:hypothetical protein